MRTDDRVLLVDKPAGVTSFAVVRQVRRLLRAEKAGHCGSLDPLATGLLVLCTGAATRIASIFVDLPKEYRARVRFGRATASYDADGRTTVAAPVPVLERQVVTAALERFVGTIEQRPPMVSAVKVGGKRLYDLARAGLDVERAPRQVVVHSIELGELGETHADLVVRCGRGCYVRSIAHELGEALGVPAHLESLRRTAVGAFTASRAVSLDEIRHAVSAGEDVAVPEATLRLAAATLAVSDALGFLPVLRVRREAETRVRNGAQPTAQMLRETPHGVGLHRLQSEDGRWLFGIARGPGARLELVFQDPLPVPAGETEPA